MKLTELIGLALFSVSGVVPAAATPVGSNPVLIKQVKIPNAKPGDFDQMAVDIRRNRLFVSAESSDVIEVFALRSGKFVTAISGVKAPHRLAVEETSGDLLAAIGGDNEVKLFSGAGKPLEEVATGEDPDGGVLDKQQGVFYVGSRLAVQQQHESELQAIDVNDMHVVSTMELPASTLKGMIIDQARHVLFVSMRDKNAIGVIDLDTKSLAGIWSPPGLTRPVPLALDQREHLLFVGARTPGKLFVLDSNTGQLIQTLDCTDISDSMWFDQQNRQLYVSGHGGLSVFRVEADRNVVPEALIDTKEGKSSILVQELHRLYVVSPKVGDRDAELEIFNLNGSGR
jgi:hypothetical protein